MVNIQEIFKQAVALHQAGKLFEAKEKYQELLNYSKNVDLYSVLAITCFDLKQYNEAISYCQEGLKLEQRVDFIEIIANSYVMTQNLSSAIPFYIKITELEPNNPQAFYILARNLFRANQVYDAAAAYLRASVLNPAYVATHEPIGNILG